MQGNWERIYTTKLYTEAEIVRGKLERNEIPVQLLNKQDTMYNIAMGEIEVYVPRQLSELAKGLLQQTLEN